MRSGPVTITSAFTPSTASERRRYTSKTVSVGEKATFTLVSVALEEPRLTLRMTSIWLRA